MTEKEYRSLSHFSFSSLKVFDESRGKFHREFILGRKVWDEDKPYAMIFGELVDCLLFSKSSFDDKFAMVQTGNKPPGQMKDFVDNMWKVTKEYIDTDGTLTQSMSFIAEEAFRMTCFNRNGEQVAFKGKTLQWAVDQFDIWGKAYYTALRTNYGKTIIDTKIREAAEKTVEELLTNTVTAPLLTLRSSEEIEVIYQLPIVFHYMGMTLKGMPDMVIINHRSKTIEFFDLKTSGWDIGTFDYNILRQRYYLQWSLYWLAVKSWAEENELADYKVIPMKFIVVSADMSSLPLIYITDQNDLRCGLDGFTLNGRSYRGVKQIIEDLNFHLTSGIWGMSREDYNNRGQRKVQLFSDNSVDL